MITNADEESNEGAPASTSSSAGTSAIDLPNMTNKGYSVTPKSTLTETSGPKSGPTDPRFTDVVKLNDYLRHGRRPQFWEENYVKRVMEAVRVKELEMKQAAEILGVSYGTLYGRYRDVYGCINRQYRTARDFWQAKGPSEVLERLQRGELSLDAGATALGVSTSNLAAYMADIQPVERAHAPPRESEASEMEATPLLSTGPTPAPDVSLSFEVSSDRDVEAGCSDARVAAAAEDGKRLDEYLQCGSTSSSTVYEYDTLSVLDSDSDDYVYVFMSFAISEQEVEDMGELRDAIELREAELVRELIAGVKDARALAAALHCCTYLYCNTSTQQVRTQFEVKLQVSKMEIIQEIIATAEQNGTKMNVLESYDSTGWTPLSWAIAKGDLEVVKLLTKAGACLGSIRTQSGGIVLHITANERLLHILKYLLENRFKHETDYLPDNNGCYPIHYATSAGEVSAVKLLLKSFTSEQLKLQNADLRTCWHLLATGAVFDEIAQHMLVAGAPFNRSFLNVVDWQGDTPVRLLASLGRAAATALLLRNGAALSVEGETESAVKSIVKNIRNPSTFLESVFDECIYENAKQVCVIYDVLTDGGKMSQIEVIEELVTCGQSKLLKHPMIESLIYLKWRCLLPVFYVILAVYATFLGALNTFVVGIFYAIDTNNGSLCDGEMTPDAPCVNVCGYHSWISGVLVFISLSLLLTQELMRIYLQRFRYFTRVESCVRLCGMVLAVLVLALVRCGAAEPWQRHVACAALLLAWLQAMLLLARCPGWGYYVLMLERVAINMFKILVTSICLVVGFAISFMIYYKAKPPFDGPVAAFVKTLVMMVSEFDYEDLFGEDHDPELGDSRSVVRLLFTMFLIFVAVVLMNFMIGVAVSDINQLTHIGNIRRLEKQVELLSTLEGLGNTFGKWSSKLLRTIRYHNGIAGGKTSSNNKWTVSHHNERRRHCWFLLSLPPKLENNIYERARKNKHDVITLDTLYETVVGIPQNSKLNNNAGGSNPTVALKDRIKSIQNVNKEMKKSIDHLNDRIDSIDEMKQSIDHLKEEMRKIIGILSSSHCAPDRGGMVYSNAKKRRSL